MTQEPKIRRTKKQGSSLTPSIFATVLLLAVCVPLPGLAQQCDGWDCSANNVLTTSDHVGIGTQSPEETLHVEGGARFGSSSGWLRLGHDSANAVLDNFGDGTLLINWYGVGDVAIGTRSGNKKNLTVGGRTNVQGSDFVLGTDDGRVIGTRTRQRALVHGGPPVGAKVEDSLIVNYAGDFEGGIQMSGPRTIIGDQHIVSGDHTDYRLAVDGKLVAREIVVTDGSEWADYVFADDYPLRPLDDLAQFIAQHGHLPGIPTTAEVEQEGFEVAKMTGSLLEKIEELTLHLIAQDAALAEQQAVLDAQKQQIDRLLDHLGSTDER